MTVVHFGAKTKSVILSSSRKSYQYSLSSGTRSPISSGNIKAGFHASIAITDKCILSIVLVCSIGRMIITYRQSSLGMSLRCR